jgi:MFS family permease
MKSNLSVLPALETPTRVRYGVLGFACALSMITYLDRVCFAYAVPNLVSVLGLQSEGDLWWAMAAFTFAYAAFEVPSGWLGDVYGPRRVLIRIVLSWSVFTALTGLVGMPLGGLVIGFWGLVLIRLLFGMGEAGAYPNITRALHNWFPFTERGKAQGMVWMSGRLMGGLTPLLWLLLLKGISRTSLSETGEVVTTVVIPPLLDWRATFWLFGGLGVLWCILFALWFRNRPEQKPSVNAAERELIHGGGTEQAAGHAGVPWLRLLRNGNLWMLCLMYACASYGWYFNITFYPTFLKEQFDVQDDSVIGAIYKGGPLLLGAAACWSGGWLTDWFIRRTGNRKWGRRLFGVVGHGLCAACYLACLVAPNPFAFFLAISLASFCNDLTMGAAWATCQDIGKRYAAIVAGCMNTIGNLGGTVANVVTGLIVQHSLTSYATTKSLSVDALSQADKIAGKHSGYQLSLATFAVAYAVAVFLWLRVDATKPVAVEEQGASPNRS